MTTGEFKNYAKAYHVDLTTEQCGLLLDYMRSLLIVNEKINLTAVREETDFIDKHLIDSLLCDLKDMKPGSKILDVGTGGGFPGVPLAIKYPEIEFVLLDSTAKKCAVVEELVRELGLKNVSVITGRAEELAREKNYRESFDGVVSRGVAALSILCELCIPFLKKGGKFYSWKGRQAQKEIDEAKNAFKKLNSEIIDLKKHYLMKIDENHVIITILKKEKHSEKYPRQFNVIKKKPL